MKHFLATLTVFFVLCVLLVNPARAGDAISINFEGVDIRVLVKFMSELTGENYIVDERVKGLVTVLSPKKVPVDEALEVLENVLAVNNFAIVSSGRIHRVVPRQDAGVVMQRQNAQELGSVVTRVFHLRHTESDKMRELLSGMVSGKGHVASFGASNSVVVTDTGEQVAQIGKLIEKLDCKADSGTSVTERVFQLKNTTPSVMAQLLEKVFNRENPTTVGFANTASDKDTSCVFVPSDPTGDIVVTAPSGMMERIAETIAKMDVKVDQILVEALIVEMTDEKTEEWGLELVAAGGVVYGTPSGFANTAAQGLTKTILTGGQAAVTSAGYVDKVKNLGGVLVPDKAGLIKAAKGDSDIRVLSAPRVLTSNNQEAEILVGSNVPFIRNSQVTAEGGTVKTFEYKDVGLLLKILPNIMEDAYIKLKIHQEIESIIGSAFEGAVETSKRRVTSTVYLNNAQTVVLGGLKSSEDKDEISKVPLLGDIPLLGLIFRSKKKAKVNMNLFLFITPTLISEPSELEGPTQQAKALVGGLDADGVRKADKAGLPAFAQSANAGGAGASS